MPSGIGIDSQIDVVLVFRHFYSMV
jgi:hypothetical protein